MIISFVNNPDEVRHTVKGSIIEKTRSTSEGTNVIVLYVSHLKYIFSDILLYVHASKNPFFASLARRRL